MLKQLLMLLSEKRKEGWTLNSTYFSSDNYNNCKLFYIYIFIFLILLQISSKSTTWPSQYFAETLRMHFVFWRVPFFPSHQTSF